jgi:C4-type Zn-finger protein
MKKYIFITPEGLTFKPNFDRPEPDRLDLHIFGFNQDISVENAIQELIELNENASREEFERPFTLRIENDKQKSFWVREKKNKTSMAS